MDRSNRKNDNNADEEFEKYLDKFFSPKCESIIKCDGLTQDVELQLQQIDYAAKYKGEPVNIEKKTKLHQLMPAEKAKGTETTFAFEIISTQKTKAKTEGTTKEPRFIDGWFISNRAKSDYYLLFYPHADKTYSKWELGKVMECNYTDADFIFIRKTKIIDWLSNLRISVCRLVLLSFFLMKKAGYELGEQYLSKMELNEKKFYKKDNKHYLLLFENKKMPYLCFSNDLAEKPVNLIIQRKELEQMAEYYGTVTREYVKLINQKGETIILR